MKCKTETNDFQVLINIESHTHEFIHEHIILLV